MYAGSKVDFPLMKATYGSGRVDLSTACVWTVDCRLSVVGCRFLTANGLWLNSEDGPVGVTDNSTTHQ